MAKAAEGVSENLRAAWNHTPGTNAASAAPASASRRPATPSHNPTSAQRPTTESSALATWSAWRGSATASLRTTFPMKIQSGNPGGSGMWRAGSNSTTPHASSASSCSQAPSGSSSRRDSSTRSITAALAAPDAKRPPSDSSGHGNTFAARGETRCQRRFTRGV